MPYVNVNYNDEIHKLKAYNGEYISDVLKRGGIYFPMPCGGVGNCGKCKVKFLTEQEITDYDKKKLTVDELNDGMRLACKAQVKGVCEIYINDEKKIKTAHLTNTFKTDKPYIFIDLGSTTVCLSYIDNQIQKNISFENRQRAYGSDVISRIAYSDYKKLSDIIKQDIKNNIDILKNELNIKITPDIIIGGNTVMEYLFLGKNPEKLGTYPFTYERLGEKYFDDTLKANITILPCISAFVGGDIVAGAIGLDIDKNKNTMLIDLGTNGEIFLNYNGKYFCSSVAAGPAFEGGNLICGMPSIQGAINKVYRDNGLKYETIENKPAIGICSSGIIDLISNILDNEMDNTGLLDDKYFEDGLYISENVKITQLDIRQFQYAKSAIRTGIDIIINQSGASYSEIDKIYLSGGFGNNIDINNIAKLKIIPDEFINKTYFASNSCLKGLVKFSDEKVFERSIEIAENTTTINLSEDKNFNDLFINNLNF